ncbi:hypothetical protein XM47_18075 [Catenovulum maritimum]|uniref:Uncharacterized protein n=2 Tax=Catenovulum maritimum TaxID=1513271 RepID=A0A0J8GR83_9ALTE|nr:hypothetical protein XM47_18075 [Catenovulum maritimum]
MALVNMAYSKRRFALTWFVGGYLSSFMSTIIGVMYWSYQKAEWKIDVVSEIIASSIMLPIGWLFCLVAPLSIPSMLGAWVSIIGFVWACRLKNIKPLYLSFAGCFIFGLYWPMAFWTMMSV